MAHFSEPKVEYLKYRVKYTVRRNNGTLVKRSVHTNDPSWYKNATTRDGLPRFEDVKVLELKKPHKQEYVDFFL